MQEKDRRRIIGFLHDKGYDFFDLNGLTIMEVNELVMDFNEEMKEREKRIRMGKRRS